MNNKIILGMCLSMCFGNVAYAQITSNVANQKLTSTAKQKVLSGGINLTSLLNNDSNDLIIEYSADASANKNTSESRNYIQQRKQQLQANFQRLGGFQLLRDYNALPVSFHRINNRDTLVDLLNDPNVKAVYPNRISQKFSDKSYELIGQTAAAAKGFKGDGTTVAVLDTGVKYNHADFGNCTAPGTPSTCRVSNSIDIAPNDNSLDADGHGSNVAGIVSKVAPNSKIVVLDVFRGDQAADSDIISALNWVANNGPSLNIKSVNLSLGANGVYYNSTCNNSALTNSFAKLRNIGIVPVVASGNEGNRTGIAYPSCTAGAVSVGAVYDSNIGSARFTGCSDSSTFSDKVTCFTNSGSNLTLLAPGVGMTAGGYTQNGTSQAAPHVAAAIAVLRAPNAIPNETIDQTIARLKNTGTLVTDTRNNLRIPRININAALEGLTAQQPPVVTPPTNPPVITPPTNPPVVTPPVIQPPVVVTPAPKKNCTTYFFFTICNG